MNQYAGVVLFCGIWAGVAVLIRFLRRKMGVSKRSYDERQMAMRGTAYRYATITGVLGGMIASILVEMNLLPVTGSFAMMVVSLLMVVVYVVSMILNGAYFGISGRWKTWTAVMLLLGLVNLYLGISRIAEEGLPEGRLTLINLTLPLGIMLTIITAAVFFQRARELREDAE